MNFLDWEDMGDISNSSIHSKGLFAFQEFVTMDGPGATPNQNPVSLNVLTQKQVCRAHGWAWRDSKAAVGAPPLDGYLGEDCDCSLPSRKDDASWV